MSYTNFFLNGAPGLPEYRRDYYPKDSDAVELDKTKRLFPFVGAKTHTENGVNHMTKIFIDNTFSYTTVSAEKRDECQNIWHSFLNKSRTLNVIPGIAGSVLLGITISLAVHLIMPVITTLVLSAISIALLGISFVAKARAEQARKEYDSWADPHKEFVAACKRYFDAVKTENLSRA